jgi:RluA family pseudouridine synthase
MNWNMRILYEDPAILIIDKPAGVISISDGYDKSIPHLRTLLEPDFGKVWIVHRLDKETSGIMVLARSAAAHKVLCEQFTTHSIKKEYVALVAGYCLDSFMDNSPLLIDGDRRHRTVVNKEKGKPGSTEFQLQESYPAGVSQLIVHPHTGYTHQIRAHLFHSGYPILGDRLYSTPESKALSERLQIQRVALHARKITFYHPIQNQELSFWSDFPDDFQQMIDRCKTNERQ